MLTGLRRTDAATVRWEHVDLDAGTIHRPSPKGGEDRAFTVPLSSAALDILRRRRAENGMMYGDGGWAFPSRDLHGRPSHVASPREDGLPSPHRLRDTFATAAGEAGVGMLELKVLLDHALPSGDVTMGYVRPSVERLREAAEQVARFLLEKMAPPSAPTGDGSGSAPFLREERRPV